MKSLVGCRESCKFVGTIRQIMSKGIQNISAGIRAKVAVIADRQAMLVETIRRQRAQVSDLQRQVADLEAEVSRLRADNEYLTVVRAAAVTPQQAEQSRAMLAGLVREIDRCIAELKAC